MIHQSALDSGFRRNDGVRRKVSSCRDSRIDYGLHYAGLKLENLMNETTSETTGRSNLIWAALLLLMCADSLFWPPTKYFSAAGYLAWSFAFAIKGFNWFESRRWGPAAYKTLTVLAAALLLFSMGRRLLA